MFAAYQEGGQTCIAGVLLPRRPELGQPRLLPARRPLARPSRRCWRASSPSSTTTSRCRALILISATTLPNRELLAEALSTKAERKVEIRVPQRGTKTGDRRARHAERARGAGRAGWPRAPRSAACSKGCRSGSGWRASPRRIEVFDNSHIQGANAVGAMIVAGPEGFVKNQYRKFNIKSADLAPGDDYAMMREVLTRRFKRLVLDEAEAPSRPCGSDRRASGVRPEGLTRLSPASSSRSPRRSTAAAAAGWRSACCARMRTAPPSVRDELAVIEADADATA